MGPEPGHLCEIRVLNRIVRLTGMGFAQEADPRHAEQLARDVTQLCRGNATGSGMTSLSSPGFKREPAAEEAGSIALLGLG